MNTCCICGKETGNNAQAIIVNGKDHPICVDCAALLDVIEGEGQVTAAGTKAIDAIRKKMADNNTAKEVIFAVDEIISPSESTNIEEVIAKEDLQEKAQAAIEDVEKEEPEQPPQNTIDRLVHLLSTFAIIFLIAGVLMSLIVGGILAGHYETSATGWLLIIGGTLLTILSFAMIMLLLSVAEAIGRIDQRMETVETSLLMLCKKGRTSTGTKTTSRKKTK